MVDSNRTEDNQLAPGLESCKSISCGVLGSMLASFIVEASKSGWAAALAAVSLGYAAPVVIVGSLFGATRAALAGC